MGIRDDLGKLGKSAANAIGASLTDWAGVGNLSKADNSDSTPGNAGQDTAKGNPIPTEKATSDPKAMLWDPYSVVEQLGFKDRPSSITYGTLKAITYRMPVVAAIIQTRINQIASFCVPQPDEYGIGFKIKLRESDKEPTKAELDWIKQAETLILRTGVTDNPRGRDSFEMFMRKIMWDSLVYDAACFEIVPNRKGNPAKWVAVDAATMRLADSANFNYDEDDVSAIRTVQIYDGMVVAEFNQEEMCYGVRNPRSDIHLQGYGISEIEMLIPTITSLLYSWDFNTKFFTQGSATKGILNFKGTVPEKQLQAFRRQWYTQIASVENCVAGDTILWISDGGKTIRDIVGNAQEKPIRIWTGDSWVDSLAYKTSEPKRLIYTTLTNGVKTGTSPDHRFRVLGDDGDPAWKTQKDLRIGDFVLVNKQSVFSDATLPSYNGRTITPDMMEILGWMIGDGYVAHNGRCQNRSNCMELFYHPEEEGWILDRHLEIMNQFGLPARKTVKHLTEEQVEHIKQKYGFKSVLPVTTRARVGSVDFIEWLLSIGFNASKEGKVIPSFVYVLPYEYKATFLKGLFSADGNCAKRMSPEITISSDILRNQVKNLLLSIGIRTNLSEGKTKLVMHNAKRSIVNRPSVLRIRDKDAFFEKIGFLQDHKQPLPVKKANERSKRMMVAKATVKKYLKLVREANDKSGKTLLTRRQRMDMNSILCGIDGCSLPRLIRFMNTAQVDVPRWMVDYHFESVAEVVDTGEYVQMYDVEVYDDRHQFAASGVIQHNSWRTPITNSEDLQWINMQQSARDMEFSAWMDFQIKVACALFTIDPAEINFQYGNTGQKSTLSEGDNTQKITESKDRGLKPLLRFGASLINQHILWPINESFEFEFVGLNASTKGEEADHDQKLVKSYKTVDEIRAKNDLPALPDGKGEVILDPTWLQWANMKDGGGEPEEGGFPGGEPGDDTDTDDGGDDYEKLLAQYENEETDEDEKSEEDTEKSMTPQRWAVNL